MASELDLAGSFIPSLHRPSSLLPIARHRQSLLYLIETFPITIVVGQTGSGKTTQIPQFLEQVGVSVSKVSTACYSEKTEKHSILVLNGCRQSSQITDSCTDISIDDADSVDFQWCDEGKVVAVTQVGEFILDRSHIICSY